MGEYFGIEAGTQMYEAASVIIATGVVQTATIKGEEEFLGRGVSYCATCDAPLYKQGNLLVIGYNKAAEAEALYLSEIAEKVSYIPVSYTHLIETYIEKNNLQLVDETKREIVDLYEEDFVKIDGTGLAGDIYDAIPANLSGNASRYILSSAREGIRSAKVREMCIRDSNTSYHPLHGRGC